MSLRRSRAEPMGRPASTKTATSPGLPPDAVMHPRGGARAIEAGRSADFYAGAPIDDFDSIGRADLDLLAPRAPHLDAFVLGADVLPTIDRIMRRFCPTDLHRDVVRHRRNIGPGEKTTRHMTGDHLE